MNELLMILVFAVSGSLFALGGTDIGGNGYKWIRRFVLPLFLIAVAIFHSAWWQAVGYGLTLCAFLHLGYGDRCSWLKRVIIFAWYGCASLWFGFSYWCVITPAVLSLLFLGSNWKPLATTIFWKSWEFLVGTLIGISFVGALLNKW